MLSERNQFEKILHDNGHLFNNDEIEEAIELYNLALEGDIEAMLNIASIYRQCQKYSTAVKWLERVSATGNTTAIFELANCYFEGLGVKEDYRKAHTLYKEAAEKGHPDAANNLADMYLNGEGVPANEKEALFWFEIAASLHVVEAMFTLGIMYEQGIGIQVDEHKAFGYYLQSAEGGYDDAQYRVGTVYLEGLLGQQKNISQALKWFEQAAEQSHHIDSIYNLGFLYENGLGVQRNGKKALQYYKRAALLGDYQAKLNISSIYEHGIDVPKDKKEAARWRKLASQHMNIFQ